MSLVGKVFAVIALVVAVFYTGITAALVSLQENFKAKLVNAEAKHKDDLKLKDNKIAEKSYSIDRLGKERDLLTGRCARLEGQNKSLSSQYSQAYEANRVAMKLLEDQEAQITQLDSQIERWRTDLTNKDKANVELRDKITELNGSMTDMTKKRDALQDLVLVREKKLDNLKQEAGKITGDLAYANDLLEKLKKNRRDIYEELVRGETIEAEKVIRGKVTAVDDEVGLVIISAGERQEVKKGFSFIVYRGDKYVGKILVDEVFPDGAAALYVRPEMQMPVEVGDDVTTKLVLQF